MTIGMKRPDEESERYVEVDIATPNRHRSEDAEKCRVAIRDWLHRLITRDLQLSQPIMTFGVTTIPIRQVNRLPR
ncbi:hypothetical protein IFM47457_03482 [Aspergillus lentulus]|nr:hypothetical protein IFM47457_03482 [Aspergillus lentulus]